MSNELENDVVLEFINRRFKEDCHWTDGNCYYFALILSRRFGGTICYDQIDGHFSTLIYGKYYDFTGIIEPSKEVMSLDYIRDHDSSLYFRLIDDCIN